ncbi:hypothetical protein A7U60_g5617 [Sanghuangporus baumii]|uniref:Uncharacterized protein n=1 Tax=Sanghuangporus baumii TaxID=108892 RepID=A0A9Q5N861_SANBA|nr:hypothetical protein A7U60_g5617 [Sanghuangporus baumii]
MEDHAEQTTTRHVQPIAQKSVAANSRMTNLATAIPEINTRVTPPMHPRTMRITCTITLLYTTPNDRDLGAKSTLREAEMSQDSVKYFVFINHTQLHVHAIRVTVHKASAHS